MITAVLIAPDTMLIKSIRQGYGLILSMIVDASKTPSATIEANEMMQVKLLIVKKIS
jgi:hypothetical protein